MDQTTDHSPEARRHTPALLVAALVVLGAYLWTFAVLMNRREGNISWFVVAGGPAVDPARIPPGLSIIPGVAGYDGVAFYRLAVDPFTERTTDFGITLDNPAYRQQRILYPLIVHVLSFGHVEWIPTLLVVVNLAAVVLLTIGAGRVAEQHGISPYWGVMVPLYPGFFIAFSRDTCEIVAWAFGAWAIAALGSARWKAAAVFLCCAVLARESTLLLPAAMLAVDAWRVVTRRERLFPAIPFAAPLLVYGLWQAALRLRWGLSGFEGGAFAAAIPFSGYLHVFAAAAERRTVLMRVHFAECVFLGLLVVVVAFAMRRTKTQLEWRLAWLGYLSLAAILRPDVWSEHVSFMRVLGDLFGVSAILLFGSTAWTRWIVALASCSVSFYAMTHMR